MKHRIGLFVRVYTGPAFALAMLLAVVTLGFSMWVFEAAWDW